MPNIKVTNADEIPVGRYGLTIQPGETVEVAPDVVLAHSAMEISLAAQVMARRVSRAAFLYETELERQARERRENRMVVQHYVQVKNGFLALLRRVFRRPPALREEILRGW